MAGFGCIECVADDLMMGNERLQCQCAQLILQISDDFCGLRSASEVGVLVRKLLLGTIQGATIWKKPAHQTDSRLCLQWSSFRRSAKEIGGRPASRLSAFENCACVRVLKIGSQILTKIGFLTTISQCCALFAVFMNVMLLRSVICQMTISFSHQIESAHNSFARCCASFAVFNSS